MDPPASPPPQQLARRPRLDLEPLSLGPVTEDYNIAGYLNPAEPITYYFQQARDESKVYRASPLYLFPRRPPEFLGDFERFWVPVQLLRNCAATWRRHYTMIYRSNAELKARIGMWQNNQALATERALLRHHRSVNSLAQSRQLVRGRGHQQTWVRADLKQQHAYMNERALALWIYHTQGEDRIALLRWPFDPMFNPNPELYRNGVIYVNPDTNELVYYPIIAEAQAMDGNYMQFAVPVESFDTEPEDN